MRYNIAKKDGQYVLVTFDDGKVVEEMAYPVIAPIKDRIRSSWEQNWPDQFAFRAPAGYEQLSRQEISELERAAPDEPSPRHPARSPMLETALR